MSADFIKKIIEAEIIDLEFSFIVAKKYAAFTSQPQLKKELQEVLVIIIENWRKVTPDAHELWIALFESIGFYPYLEKYKSKLKLTHTADLIRKEYFRSSNLKGVYFHEEQKELVNILRAGKNLIVSAPTSFGKSLLIEEVVASKAFKNIVVIQPTLALLDETRKKLSKYSDSYKIIVKTSQTVDANKGNIFVLTAERVMEYSNLPAIDFFIVDEFYKLSAQRDDERSDVLNNAVHLLLRKHQSSFMMLGPNIESISDGFAEAFNADFYKTNYSLVLNNEVNLFDEISLITGNSKEKTAAKEFRLFELLYSLRNEQTLIFCSSPARVRSLSKSYAKYLNSMGIKPYVPLPIVEWIEKNINKDWSLITCLNYGIGIHDGALPRHITASLIAYFNELKLRCIFCTTTIIEGVNTCAKNIIYYDQTKGNKKKIDYFDYSNIKGRAGRMMVHLTGNIYNFNRPPEKEKVTIDIPFFEQNPISDEVLINLDVNEIRDSNSEQNRYVQGIPESIKDIFKKNGVSIRGQHGILTELMNLSNTSLICWSGFPNKDQLKYILELSWKYLIKPGETTTPMTTDKLATVTSIYTQNKSVNMLISKNYDYYRKLAINSKKSNADILDEAIKDSFQILRHWIEYKVPKWLSVVHVLQKYVCAERSIAHGDYLYYANILENSFLPPNLSLLLEYGIPSSAINKISKSIPTDLNEDSVLRYISNNHVAEKCGLIQYELEFFK